MAVFCVLFRAPSVPWLSVCGGGGDGGGQRRDETSDVNVPTKKGRGARVRLSFCSLSEDYSITKMVDEQTETERHFWLEEMRVLVQNSVAMAQSSGTKGAKREV